MKRICSKTEDYEKHRQELKTQLRKRGYSGKFIEAQLQRADRLNRQDLLVYKDRNKKKTGKSTTSLDIYEAVTGGWGKCKEEYGYFV